MKGSPQECKKMYDYVQLKQLFLLVNYAYGIKLKKHLNVEKCIDQSEMLQCKKSNKSCRI